MSDLQAALFVLIPLSIGTFITWRWIFSSGPSEVDIKEHNERFRTRQLNPDSEAFRQKYGVNPPESLKELYRRTEIFSPDWDSLKSVVTDETGMERTFYFAWIEPMDKEFLNKPPWPGTEGCFSFANDGAGDQYLIDPKQTDPEVFYYQHESARKTGTGVKLSQFASSISRDDEED